MFGASKTKQVSSAANYIEDVFSTYLYTGNGSTQSIVNGIDLSTQGGMTWLKARDVSASNYLFDTARGRAYSIRSDSTAGQATSGSTNDLTSFNTNGFSLGVSSQTYTNVNASTFASWTFRKQPKFFDVQTFNLASNGSATFSHNLGSTPGCIIIKTTSTTSSWFVWHRSLSSNNALYLNNTFAATDQGVTWLTATSTTISLAPYVVDASVQSCVAYLFAHNAGGFGLTGTDNVISCGSFTCDGSGNATVNLGYEPQWILGKYTGGASQWFIFDNMRGWAYTNTAYLQPNNSSAEGNYGATDVGEPTATGFNIKQFGASQSYIYIAIRRGPMKVPTDGTKVFTPATRTGTGSAASVTSAGFPIDLIFSGDRTVARGFNWDDRLSGAKQSLRSWDTAGYTSDTQGVTGFDSMTGMSLGDGSTFGGGYNVSGENYVYQMLRRAPSFFDEVCYTGTGSTMTISHNLGVAPELIILKERNAAGGWIVYSSPTGFSVGGNLAGTGAFSGGLAYVSATSSTTFTTITNATTWVSYLFATCAGVSKVGSYTGNGTTQTINCGFAGGARFVLIKRTDSTGDWYVYDTARGMTTLVDPYLLLNSTAAESATLGSVTTVTTGFAINASILAAINTNGASYIYLSIA